jgi:hypothetical protein
MSNKNKLSDLIEKTINNIDDDRSTANKLLTDLIIYMAKEGDVSHASHGHIAAQYLETLQRSNEQLVKIASIMQKEEGSSSKSLTAKDKEGLFDMIKDK